jgi:hypothetical protein
MGLMSFAVIPKMDEVGSVLDTKGAMTESGVWGV